MKKECGKYVKKDYEITIIKKDKVTKTIQTVYRLSDGEVFSKIKTTEEKKLLLD